MKINKQSLEAIKQLEAAFAHNKAFKKSWLDYIELSIIEAIEQKNIAIPDAEQTVLAKEAGKQIINLFDPVWWEMQIEK